MVTDAPRPTVLVVTTRPRRPTASFVIVPACLGLVGLLFWVGNNTVPEQSSGWQMLTLLGFTAALAADFWVLGAHVEAIGDWWWARRRACPAMRLGPGGLDYSAAFRGSFELHVDWVHAMQTRVHPGPAGNGTFWCLYAPVIEGTGDLAAFLDPDEVPGPDDAYAAARAQHRQALADGLVDVDLDQLSHLLAFGTPIALNLAIADGADLTEVHTCLQDWTSGRCSLADTS